MFVSLKNFTFSYNDNNTVLKNINLEIKKGEKIGLLGINGSGKTTLLNCIFGELETNEGILVFEKSPFKNADEIRKRIGFVTDTVDIIDYLTLKELIVFMEYIYGKENLDFDKLDKLLTLFNIKDVYDSKLIKNYSFGMKKKLQLISLLIAPYQFYIVDEPTNGLDIVSVYYLKKIFNELKDATYIVSSHEIGFVKETCEKVVFIKNGVLSEKLDISNLTAEELEKLFMDWYHEK